MTRGACVRAGARRLLGLMLASLALLGCAKSDDSPKPAASATAQSGAKAFVVRPDTPNLLITWIDDKGDFIVVEKPDDVPAEGRKAVRVVNTTREDGTRDPVYVADLSQKNPDGTYPVRAMSRAEWEEMGASRRKARLEALAPSAEPPPSAAPSSAPAKGKPASKITVVIYGASWCKPCHQAADYLRAKGIAVVEKDIEKSDAAQAEMSQKLARAGRSGASIPVIDVMGQILVGYSPQALDRALETARASKTL